MIIHDGDDSDDDDDDTVTYHNNLKPQPFRLSEEAFNNSCNYRMV
jgi:hypothetical protein